MWEDPVIYAPTRGAQIMKIDRREFIVAGAAIATTQLLNNGPNAFAQSAAPHSVPALPYPYEALEPHIDKMTMTIHHDKHHAAYVKNLNTALESEPSLQGKPIEELLKNSASLPEKIRQAVINNGGGHANHTHFWESMAPGKGGNPSGAIADGINGAFGSFDKFKEVFAEAGVKRFGSGWAWLVKNKEGKLAVYSTANQDSPIMQGDTPLLGLDVWEHAYYLKYQNLRPDYIKAWWNVVNWGKVNERLKLIGIEMFFDFVGGKRNRLPSLFI